MSESEDAKEREEKRERIRERRRGGGEGGPGNLISNRDNNPCLVESNLSLKCLDKNGYNQKKCELEFENYRTCKQFWFDIERERKKKGLLPTLPPPEDRDAIKREKMEQMRARTRPF